MAFPEYLVMLCLGNQWEDTVNPSGITPNILVNNATQLQIANNNCAIGANIVK
jgi:hypothetical protein